MPASALVDVAVNVPGSVSETVTVPDVPPPDNPSPAVTPSISPKERSLVTSALVRYIIFPELSSCRILPPDTGVPDVAAASVVRVVVRYY